MESKKRIAFIIPKRLGDAIFHTPALEFIKRTKPHWIIDAITVGTLSAEVLENNPYIDDLLCTPEVSELKLRSGRYDLAICCYPSDAADEYIQALDTEPNVTLLPLQQHTSIEIVAFVQKILGTETAPPRYSYGVFPRKKHFQNIEKRLVSKRAFPNEEVLVGIHLGCHGVSKRHKKFWKSLSHPKIWEPEQIIEFSHLLKEHDKRFRLILTGSKGEARIAKKIVHKNHEIIDLVNETSVLELAALMKYLNCYVTPDTGAMHVASATQVPLVALFGPTSPEITGPCPERKNLAVFRAQNVRDIPVTDVFQKVKEFVNNH